MGSQWAAQWKVHSKSDPAKVYTVSVAKTGRWACDCPAHRFAKAPKADCKHIRETRLSQEIAVATGVQTVGQVKGQTAMPKQTGVVVVQTPSVLVIQTRREICLEED